MNGSVKENGQRLSFSPFWPQQLNRPGDKVGRDGLNGDVPKTGAPGQVCISQGPLGDIQNELRQQQARKHHQRHEITAPIESAAPPDEHQHMRDE